jgi:hypothetical protein
MAATTIIINDETPRRQYTATSGQTVFDFPIPFFEEGDLTVFLTPAGNTADDAADLLTITTDYTVNGEDTQDGGEIVLTTGATAGDIITIIREVDIARTTDYQAAGDLLAETLNREQDINIMIAQQLRADHAGIVSRAVSSSSNADLTLPEPDGNYILGWNAAADGLQNFQEIGTYQGTDATTTTSAYVIRDLVKDSSNNNVYICTANSPSGTALTNTSYWKLIVDAASATSSASAAASSATAAAASATAAAASETAAAASESAAGTSETNAASSASAASTSATNAASSASAASSSASAASTSETNAAASETAAAASESAAATSASNAATSATNAAGSATTATTQASAASTSATNAATSASAAATSASNASTSESNAATSASAAQAALDSIENFYLGASATAPTVDDNGDPLAAGDWYFNTTDNLTYIYNGSSWQVTVVDTSGFVATTGDTMTGNLSFGDGNKAIFGVGSDLQIYHDGSNSYVIDQGTGNLTLQSNGTGVVIQGTSGTKNIVAYTDGATNLYYNGGPPKLVTTSTGVSVTGRAVGTTTTDNDLSFDMQASNNFSCTPSGTGTLTFTNITSGQSGNIYLDNSGGHVISAAATTFISAADLTKISTAGKYFVSYYSADGTNVLVSASSAVTASGA